MTIINDLYEDNQTSPKRYNITIDDITFEFDESNGDTGLLSVLFENAGKKALEMRGPETGRWVDELS